MVNRRTLLTTIISASISTPLIADNWLRFRGEQGAGVTDQATPNSWSSKSNIRWQIKLPGPGASSPIVVRNQVFVTAYSGYSAKSGSAEKMLRHLICVNRQTGKLDWEQTIPAVTPEDPAQGFLITEHGYASSTPVSDGERVYVYYGKSGVIAYDLTGKKLWTKSVGTGSSNRQWGSAASPVLFENLLIVNASEESKTIYAFDKLTGEEVWKQPASQLELSYSTPVIVNVQGKPQLLLNVPYEIWSLNPMTGKVIWYGTTGVQGNASPSAVVYDTDKVFLTGGRPGASAAYKIGVEKGDQTKANLLWKSPNYSYVPTPVYYDKHLYWVSDQGIAVCLNAETGAEVYKERVQATAGAGGGRGGMGRSFYASLVRSGDKLIAVSRTNGTFILPAKPEFKVLQHNKLDDTSECNATPAIADGEIFLRSNEALYCISEKNG